MRRLVAALACRASGSRLYGKPLQNLDVERGVTILDHLIDLIASVPVISETVLGISEGTANLPFVDVARRHGVDYVLGGERDVLERLILCAGRAKATDVFRVTTESPFFYWELVEPAWERHLERGNDVTTTDGLPEGCHFEIYTVDALEASHRRGDERHRSELCSLYVREHRDEFQVEVLPIPSEVQRLNLRLTVDYPEDLVLCREVYKRFRDQAPRLRVTQIVEFIDSRPELKALVAPYVSGERIW